MNTTIKLYAHISPETLIEKAEKAGLNPDAIEYFRHFEEVPLIVEVDETTGEVLGAKVDGELF